MKVEIMNPEVLTNLYKNHGEFACVCYDTPEKFAEKVGKSCQNDGHMSGSRCEYIKFKITDLDRGTSEQALRHEIGASIPYGMQDNYTISEYSELVKDVSPDHIIKNMASFRYIDKDGFKWETPKNINIIEEAKKEYDWLMDTINTSRSRIKSILLENDVDEKKAVEDVNFVLPRATLTGFMIGFTPEALIHFCHKRLCTRSQEFIRKLAKLMKKEVKKYNEDFAKELVPHCMFLLWCPEKSMSCGMKPTKAELIKVLERAENTDSVLQDIAKKWNTYNPGNEESDE